MSRSEIEILERGQAWVAQGERVVLATVAHTWGSSPRPAGAVMVLSESGRLAGSVSGGCIEEELLSREPFTLQPQRWSGEIRNWGQQGISFATQPGAVSISARCFARKPLAQ